MTSLFSVDVHLARDDRSTALGRDVREGLTGRKKSLPPVWFYDHRGSLLFDEITRLPEYYPTRAERSILRTHAGEVAHLARADTLVEIGSGTSDKTRLLLDAMTRSGSLQRFVPFDASEEVLREAARTIRDSYGIEVCAVVGDFHRHLDQIPTQGRRLIAFLGGTIGNLGADGRRRFLTDLGATMAPGDKLLLGADLVKDTRRLVAAYDDAAGVTAAFNLNVLAVLNAELDADFDLSSFSHRAVWNESEQWIEMRLRSEVDQRVRFPTLGLSVFFARGEELLTEISAKFTVEGLSRELGAAGFVVEKSWTDGAGDFLVSLARPDR